MAKRMTAGEVASRDGLAFQRVVIFSLCAAVFFLSQFYRASNAIIAPELQRDLSLSPESLGLLSAAFFYAFACAQIPLALFLDRLGARIIITVLTLLSSVGSLFFALSSGLYGGLAGRVLMGVGMAANLMGPLKLFTQWFSPGEFATFSGLLVGAGTLGALAATTPLALLVEIMGWRWTFIAFSALTALLAAVFYLAIQDGPGTSTKFNNGMPKAAKLTANLRFILQKRDYWLISCGTFFRYGTFMAVQALWAGPYMIEMLHFTPVAAGNIIMLSNIGYVIGCSMGGWLSDRVLSSRKQIVLMGLGGMALSELALTLYCGCSHTLMLTGVFFCFGLFAGFGNVMYAHIKGIMPLEMSGMALTGINFFTMLGVGVYIHFMGWILDHLASGRQAGLDGYQASFFLTFLGVAAAGIGYLFTHESREWSKS
jgi:nitrate/nitrite transporter NarK